MQLSDWLTLALLLLLLAFFGGSFAYLRRAARRAARAPARAAARQKYTRPAVPGSPFNPDGLLTPHNLADAPDPRLLWESLTRREKQVARLAAARLTDAEIGAQLSISDRTVGNHLYSIYRKLDITSRRDLQYFLQVLEK
jgi:DNA-binding CsgD family transcriptional regulator